MKNAKPKSKAPSKSEVAQPKLIRENLTECAAWHDEFTREVLLYEPKSGALFLEREDKNPVMIWIACAFRWWWQCKLLDEKTGEFIEYDGISELHKKVADVLAAMEE